jgi:hypothetical protein
MDYMKHLTIILIAFLFGTNCLAELVPINDDDQGTLYAERSTINKIGYRVTMTDVLDYKTTRTFDGHQHLSMAIKAEYDCEKNKRRMLQIAIFKLPLARGSPMLQSDASSEWEVINANTFEAKLASFACNQRKQKKEIIQDDKIKTIFIDRNSIRADGHLASIWVNTNYKSTQYLNEKPYRSGRYLNEFDCQGDSMHILQMSLHSKLNTSGDTMFFDQTPTTWQRVPPDTIATKILEIVCDKL